MAQGELTDAEVFGAPQPNPADGPVVGRSQSGGVTIQIAPAVSAPAQQQLSDADVFGPAGPPQDAGQTDTRPTSQALGFGVGVNTVAKNLVDLAAQHGPASLLPTGSPLGVVQDVISAPVKAFLSRFSGPLDQMSQTFRPGTAGRWGGEALASIPLAAEGGPLLTGAMQGYLTSDAADPLGKLINTAEGAVGGKIGDKVFGGLSAALAPKVRDAAQWAIDNNIRLPMGSTAGGPMQWLENAAAKGTIAGPMIGAAQRQGIDDFNLATARNALAPAGLSLPEGVQPGHESINAVRNALSGGYSALTPHLTLGADQGLQDTITKAAQAASTLPPAYQARLASITAQLPKPGGQIAGPVVQDLTSHLRQEAADATGDNDFFAKQYGRAVDDLRSGVEDALERTNPEQAAKLQGLRQGWAQLVRIQRAGRDAVQDNGVFTPKGLLAAVRATDQSAGDNATARGQALMQDWTNQGKQVLPDKLPTSSSIWAHLPELAVMLGVGRESGSPGIAALAAGEAGMAGLYTKPMQRVINAAMTQRPQVLKDMVARLQDLRGVTSDAGAMATPKLLPAPQAAVPALLPYFAAQQGQPQ